uniref:NADH-ubiquinone oxidoreductase chain 5 n=1 Tax=Trigonopterus sp. 4 AH-2016 TaxID=1903838 RepID=A0A343C418_9CUCU|nr:NADH dehydrogenase subunit 5 [Trigonopterus sp. 4 AH-2016]
MTICLFYGFIFVSISIVYFLMSFILMYDHKEIFLEFNIMSLNTMSLEFAVYVDWVSTLFSSFVFFISSMIMVYSSMYMGGDKNLKRFICLMVLFVLSMKLVIYSSNLVFILLGWDGLGLVSYALVIYYQNVKSLNAGMLTALSNRVGDAAILLSIVLLVDLGSWNYLGIFGLEDFSLSNRLILSLLIILAASTKSAQIPFSSWLPAAMAAPTPVSSLVHSSTLVTAGIYLLFRFSNLFSQDLKLIFMYISLLTMFMAGLGANFEFDLKKIIALSTLSQLGMMLVIFYLGAEYLAFFHLLMHALFKALLFMCSGVIIHSLGGMQDIRSMGGLVNVFPFTCSCFCISNMALCGLPFMSGFYSKDLIVEIFSMEVSSLLVYSVFFISVGLTVTYSVRVSLSVLVGRSNISSLSMLKETENHLMVKSMLGLVLLVIFGGSMMMWVIFSTPWLVVLPTLMKLLTLLIVILGIYLGYEISLLNFVHQPKLQSIYQVSMFVSGMWNMPILSTSTLTAYSLTFGKVLFKSVDYGWMEYYGSKGLFSEIKNLSEIFQLLIRNHLKIFLFLLWGLFIYVLFLFFI